MGVKPQGSDEVISEIRGRVGFITLNRPAALNALSLGMIRALTATLQAWRDDEQVLAVAVRGSSRSGPFGNFCAGGDIRFFHQAVLSGSPEIEDFFTEEYRLDYLIHTYPKPYIAFMDGVVFGGGMGISQGGSVRIVTEQTRMAMPETAIGLFPDVGGGYFLSRCPGRLGEYLALTGASIGGREAVAWGLADGYMESTQLQVVWETVAETPFEAGTVVEHWLGTRFIADHSRPDGLVGRINSFFSHASVKEIVDALEADPSEWAQQTAAILRKRSPLMLHVALEHIRRARRLSLAADLQLERSMMWHCFRSRPEGAGEAMEGIRALAIDKDQRPQWNPARIEDVTPEMVARFFVCPWPDQAHPLQSLA